MSLTKLLPLQSGGLCKQIEGFPDDTVLTPAEIAAGWLLMTPAEVAAWIAEHSGSDVPHWDRPGEFWDAFTDAEKLAVEAVILNERDAWLAVALRSLGMAPQVVSTSSMVIQARDRLLDIRAGGGHDDLPTAERWADILSGGVAP